MFDAPSDLDEQPLKQLTRLAAYPEDALVILDTDIGYDPDDFVSVVIAARTVSRLGIEIGGEHRFLTINGASAPTMPACDLPNSVELVGEAIAGLCATTTGPIIWVGQGPMTNLVAVLSFMPDLTERLVVTQMGGWLDNYRDTSRASHNFRIDPAAAGLALRILHKPRLVLSDVTNSPTIRVTPDWSLIHRLQEPTAPAWAHLLAAHFQTWFARRDGSWMHDPLTLSAALGEPFVCFRTERIRIADDARLYRDPDGHPLEVAYSVDYAGFLDWMQEGVHA